MGRHFLRFADGKENLMKLTDDLYAYEWKNYFENNCNSFYIGGSVQALIDPGLKSQLPGLLDQMAKDGIKKEDIRYIINTHSHPDHYEGSELFSGSEVKIALSASELDFMTKGKGAYLYELFGLRAPNVQVNLVLSDGEIKLGEETFRVVHTPGHSPGSISLYWPAKKALFSGDVIFSQNVGRTDFPGGDSSLLKESIRALSKLGAEYLLAGHLGIVKGGRNVARNFEFVIERIFSFL
jgi:glyoxylase-like metal-dependent hydrolase (beta-lactamase superfamily II)